MDNALLSLWRIDHCRVLFSSYFEAVACATKQDHWLEILLYDLFFSRNHLCVGMIIYKIQSVLFAVSSYVQCLAQTMTFLCFECAARLFEILMLHWNLGKHIFQTAKQQRWGKSHSLEPINTRLHMHIQYETPRYLCGTEGLSEHRLLALKEPIY